MIYLTRHFDADSSVEGTFLEVPTELIELLMENDTHPKTRISDDLEHFYLVDSDQEKLLSNLDRKHIRYKIYDKEHRGLVFIRHLSPAAWV